MARRNIVTIALLIFCSLAPAIAALAADVTVEAILSPRKFSVHEGARLSIVVDGVRKSADFEIPEVANLKFHQRGQSSQTSFVNGRMSASITYNFIVQALKEGSHIIPPIDVRAGGKVFRTNKIAFEVTAAGTAGNGEKKEGKSINEIAFIRVSEIGEHYPGEIVPVTIKAYFSRNYRVDLNSLPTLSGDGVVMPQLSNEPEQGQEVVGGEPFHVLTWQTSLSGIKTGKHPLQFSLDASVLVPQQRRTRSPFSSFGGSMFDDSVFDSFFGNVERRPITATSPDFIFNVQPLPKEGKPVGFTGAIGKFTLDVGASPRRVEVGEPITLTMTVGGEGNFNRVESPVFPESSSWRTYSPTSDYVKDGDTFQRTKSFEQAIVIKDPAVKEIPSLSFSYFDPGASKYVTLLSEPIPLELIRTTSQQPSPVVSSQAAPGSGGKKIDQLESDSTKQVAGAEIVFKNLSPIQLETGKFYSELQPLFKRVWFIAISAAVLLLLCLLFYLNWRKHMFERKPQLLIEMNRENQLQNDLSEVQKARDIGDSILFLNMCRKAIQNRLGAPHLENASAMSLTDLRSCVEEGSSLIRIFAMAEEVAYGGASLTAAQMDEYFTELKSELIKL